MLLVLAAGLIASCRREAVPARSPEGRAQGTSEATEAATANATSSQAEEPPAVTPRADGLTEEEAAILGSLEKVDDYPLYSMHYQGSDYAAPAGDARSRFARRQAGQPDWACSLFAALGDPEQMMYGRNFDWEYSPALLLFTDPPGGYASVSMVDLAYLGFEAADLGRLDELPLAQRKMLLRAPSLPFDGMNEHGLAVGMAAVPPGNVVPDPNKETIGSLGVIREILDRAKDVGEAVAILEGYNIEFGGGPPIHYLIADRSGRSALVEFAGGELVVMPNEQEWQAATNFLRSEAGESAAGQCWRYDRLEATLGEAQGLLDAAEAMKLLEGVTQGNTQWSVVYGISRGEVQVVMGQAYEVVHTFMLEP